jgi:hypothetical protein
MELGLELGFSFCSEIRCETPRGITHVMRHGSAPESHR